MGKRGGTNPQFQFFAFPETAMVDQFRIFCFGYRGLLMGPASCIVDDGNGMIRYWYRLFRYWHCLFSTNWDQYAEGFHAGVLTCFCELTG